MRDTTSSSKQRKDVPVTKEATDEYVSDSEQGEVSVAFMINRTYLV